MALKLDEFNNANYEGITAENFRGIDVAIEFSIPGAVLENVERICGAGREHRGRHDGLAGASGEA